MAKINEQDYIEFLHALRRAAGCLKQAMQSQVEATEQIDRAFKRIAVAAEKVKEAKHGHA